MTLAALCACLAFARAQTPQKGGGTREGVRLYPVLVNFKTGFIDRTGKLVIEPQYDLEPSFGDGLAIVRSGAGPVITPEEVEATEPVGGMVAMPAKGTGKVKKIKVEVIDTSGQAVATLPPGRDYLSSYFSEGLASFSVLDEGGGRLYGYMDGAGRVVVEPRYSAAGMFREGRADVCVALRRCGFIDREGRYVWKPSR